MIEKKLIEMGINLPKPPNPAGSYIPIVIFGKLAFVSGQIPIKDGKVVFTGKVTNNNIEQAKNSARLCAINILAQLKNELGNLDRITKIIKLEGFVNSSVDFTAHPTVINGASDFLYEVFGQKGKHSRVALGVSSLPLNSMTEIAAIVEFN